MNSRSRIRQNSFNQGITKLTRSVTPKDTSHTRSKSAAKQYDTILRIRSRETIKYETPLQNELIRKKLRPKKASYVPNSALYRNLNAKISLKSMNFNPKAAALKPRIRKFYNYYKPPQFKSASQIRRPILEMNGFSCIQKTESNSEIRKTNYINYLRNL